MFRELAHTEGRMCCSRKRGFNLLASNFQAVKLGLNLVQSPTCTSYKYQVTLQVNAPGLAGHILYKALLLLKPNMLASLGLKQGARHQKSAVNERRRHWVC